MPINTFCNSVCDQFKECLANYFVNSWSYLVIKNPKYFSFSIYASENKAVLIDCSKCQDKFLLFQS